ncbi:MAG TPA: hypothetical protein VI383_10525, partial [Gemmatimonadales bacterium]|nr:hypothetical protein [Gemmatimonadales bacterium]
PPIEASETELGYRAKVSLAVGGSGGIGYHRLGRPESVFDLTRCLIARPELNAVWQGVRANRDLLPPNADRLVLRVDRSVSCHVLVRARARVGKAGADAWTGAKSLGRALEEVGTAAVLWWEPPGGATRTMYGAGEAYPTTVFEQVHPEMGDRIRGYAVRQLGEVTGRHVWDLYAGIGETTEMIGTLGADGTTVESVEVDPRAVRVANRRTPAPGVTRVVGRVEDVLGRLRPAGAAVVNPPRAGLAAEVTRALKSRPPDRLVYVSCDPATLARDLARLASTYRLAECRAFDLFPQTAHVETVATLVRA